MKFLVVLFVSLLFATVVQIQACDVGADEQNVCLYGDALLDGDGDNVDRTRCQGVNANPFSVVAARGSGSPSASQCEAYAREDGSDCVAFYASYVCSSFCSLCGKSPCQNFCNNYQSKCPTAAAAFCFKSIACVDGTAGMTCTRWDVDTSNIPAQSATTHTTVTTTSGTNTGTSTDDGDFSTGSISVAGVLALTATAVIHAVI